MDVVKKCCFCGLSSDNEVLYGKFCEMSDIQTHYYCLLLSSNMQQHGKDHEGILGFLIKDIHKEINRGKRLKCSYCRQYGATLGCCTSKCKKVFHLPCGRTNNSLHHFFGEFKSYCSDHRPVQVVPTLVLEDSVKSTNDCAICFEVVESWPNINTLWAPCCSVNSWFHRNCIQKLALSAGYFFKCPLCNNKDYFQVSMLKQGIYIPEQDASWEMVPNAYAELLERYKQCDAEICLSPTGRKSVSRRTRWDIVLCRLCGSQGIHIACGNLKTKKPAWDCSNCTSMLESAKSRNSTSMGECGTISNNINELEEVNNSGGMRNSQQPTPNTDSHDTGCSRSPRIISTPSHFSNVIGHSDTKSNTKAIKSENINETFPSDDDDIQVASAILAESRGYATRSRVREARYLNNWATKMLFYKEKYKLKELRIVLGRCDEIFLYSKERRNKVFITNKHKELATIPSCGLKQNINKGLRLQFCCKGIFKYELKKQCFSVWGDLRSSNLRPTTSKLERSQSFKRYTESLSTVITDSSEENFDIMYSKCLQMEKSIRKYDSWTNNFLLETFKSSAFICTSNKQELEPTMYSLLGNIKHNHCKSQICVPVQTRGNEESKIFNIFDNMLNGSYNVSKIFCNIPFVSDSRKLDIHMYEKTGNDWDNTCTSQHVFALNSSLNSFNFSFYRKLDVNLKCNFSDFLNKQFGNKLWNGHSTTQSGQKVKCLFNGPSNNWSNNRNLYQNNQKALHASFTLESSNFQDKKQVSRKSPLNLLKKFRHTENYKSKRIYIRETIYRESSENTLRQSKSRHHFKRNCTDLKLYMKGDKRSDKNNIFNLKNYYPATLYSENKAVPITSSPYSDLPVRLSHSPKKLTISELKKLGAISHCPSRTTVKQINSEKLSISFDSRTENMYRGLGFACSVLK